jgi:amidase
VRGPLHGIPVLIKDNIATADKMSTTAGSLALAACAPARDAFVAAQLREAGAVIIGKTNLSEWANMRSTHSVSGWSGRGGQTRNPYALDRNTSGSSSGSGAAMAAGLATLAIGTETDGSIVSPASTAASSASSRPWAWSAAAASSRSPIAGHGRPDDAQRGRCRAAAGRDRRRRRAGRRHATTARARPATTRGAAHRWLRGKRIGVARNFFGSSPAIDAVIEKELAILKAQGATLVDVQVPNVDKYGDSELEVLLAEFRPDLEAWLPAMRRMRR